VGGLSLCEVFLNALKFVFCHFCFVEGVKAGGAGTNFSVRGLMKTVLIKLRRFLCFFDAEIKILMYES
jgi:hypothetical protein